MIEDPKAAEPLAPDCTRDMTNMVTGLLQLQQRFCLFLIGAALAVIGFGLFWFAYVDVQLVAALLLPLALANVAALASVCAAVLARQRSLEQAQFAVAHELRVEAARLREFSLKGSPERSIKVAVLMLLAAVVLTATVCLLALVLRGPDNSGNSDEQTTTRLTTTRAAFTTTVQSVEYRLASRSA